MQRDWFEYYQITKRKPPSKLLMEALGFVQHKNKAIDIGGGALKDTKYLLEQGFEITVIDSSDLMAKEAENIASEKLHAFVTAFDVFDFPENVYDIASAMYALPFNPPETFNATFERIKNSLVEGGILCGQLFGDRDEWVSRKGMTFHTKKQAEELLKDMEIISLREEEVDGTIANGALKHWHVFHFIARKV